MKMIEQVAEYLATEIKNSGIVAEALNGLKNNIGNVVRCVIVGIAIFLIGFALGVLSADTDEDYIEDIEAVEQE